MTGGGWVSEQTQTGGRWLVVGLRLVDGLLVDSDCWLGGRLVVVVAWQTQTGCGWLVFGWQTGGWLVGRLT